MTVSVNFVGERINDASTITNWDTTKLQGGGGSWSAPSTDTDNFIQGGTCLTVNSASTANRTHFVAYNLPTAYDISPGGADADKVIFIWAKMNSAMPSTGVASTLPGLGIAMSSATPTANSTNNVAWWTFYGNENFPGGYQRLTLLPTKSPTFSGAGFNPTNVQYIGVVATTVVAKAVIDILQVDAMDRGSGLNVYGNTTNDLFDEILAFDQNDTDNKYGILESLDAEDGVLRIKTQISLGDPTGTNSTNVTGNAKTIFFDTPQYFNSSNVLVNSVDDDFLKISCKGNTSASTNIQLGTLVSAVSPDDYRGRAGITLLGNTLYNCNFEFNNGDIDSLNIYGSTFSNLLPTGGLNWTATGNHSFVGSTIDNCSRFQPDSGVFITNSIFSSHTSVGLPENQAALYFTSNTPSDTVIDIKNCSFFGNDYAIEHPATGTFAYDNLIFAANTYDIYFNYTGGAIAPDPEFELTINLTNGANATTFISGVNEGDTQILSAVTLTLTNIKTNSEVRIRPSGNPDVVLFSEETVTDGTSEYTYNYPPTYSNVDIFVMNVSGYQWYSQTNYELSAGSENLFISQIPERNYST